MMHNHVKCAKCEKVGWLGWFYVLMNKKRGKEHFHYMKIISYFCSKLIQIGKNR